MRAAFNPAAWQNIPLFVVEINVHWLGQMEHSETWSNCALPTLTHLTASADFTPTSKLRCFCSRGGRNSFCCRHWKLSPRGNATVHRKLGWVQKTSRAPHGLPYCAFVTILLITVTYKFCFTKTTRSCVPQKAGFSLLPVLLLVSWLGYLLFLSKRGRKRSPTTQLIFPNCLAMCNTVYLTQALGSPKVLEIEAELYFCRYFYFCSAEFLMAEHANVVVCWRTQLQLLDPDLKVTFRKG